LSSLNSKLPVEDNRWDPCFDPKFTQKEVSMSTVKKETTALEIAKDRNHKRM
jgi:hypothetical protein